MAHLNDADQLSIRVHYWIGLDPPLTPLAVLNNAAGNFPGLKGLGERAPFALCRKKAPGCLALLTDQIRLPAAHHLRCGFVQPLDFTVQAQMHNPLGYVVQDQRFFIFDDAQGCLQLYLSGNVLKGTYCLNRAAGLVVYSFADGIDEFDPAITEQ